MTILTSVPALRWAVPAGVAAVVIGGGAAVGSISASADPELPQRSAAQLLVDLATARTDGLSGTVVQRADLGLPELPDQRQGAISDLTSLLSGKHTLRIWYAGPDQVRIALLDTLGESDLILNDGQLTLWNSRRNEYQQGKVSDPAEAHQAKPQGLPMTPQQAADALVAMLDPTTVVSTAGSARVAGREAYELVLAPRDSAALIGQVRVAIDAEEHVPLRVQAYAKGAADPAFEVTFTEINFDRPDPEQFEFNPPPGATRKDFVPTGADVGPLGDVKRVGTGWTSVLVAKAPQETTTGAAGAALQALPRVSGAWGSGRLLSGKMFSVLITDDGRVLVGFVAPERLYQAAADPAAKVD